MISFKNDAIEVIERANRKVINGRILQLEHLQSTEIVDVKEELDELLNIDKNFDKDISTLMDNLSNDKKIKYAILDEDMDDLYLFEKGRLFYIHNSKKQIILTLNIPFLCELTLDDYKYVNNKKNFVINAYYTNETDYYGQSIERLETIFYRNKVSKELREQCGYKIISEYIKQCHLMNISGRCSFEILELDNIGNFEFSYFIGDKATHINVNDKDYVKKSFYLHHEGYLRQNYNINIFGEYITFSNHEEEIYKYISDFGKIVFVAPKSKDFLEKKVIFKSEGLDIMMDIKQNTIQGVLDSNLILVVNEGLKHVETDYKFKEFVENKEEIIKYFKLLDY